MNDRAHEALPTADDSAAPEAAQARLTTGDMARLTGSTLRTVRFYEEAGLLSPEERDEGCHRLFHERELQKLQLILDLREAGLSLQDIRDLFELKESSSGASEATEAMSGILERQIDEMQRKIAKLRRLREELASTVTVINECRNCTDARFPLGCGDCEVLNRADLPRAVRLLWK